MPSSGTSFTLLNASIAVADTAAIVYQALAHLAVAAVASGRRNSIFGLTFEYIESFS